MNLNEAIKIHNELYDKEEIKKYCEALHIICEEMRNCKPKKEYYKSSIIKDYYIELPYTEVTISNGKAVYRKYGYDCLSKSKDNKTGSHYCLGLCKLNRKDIEEFVERKIVEDNLKAGEK